MADERNPSEPGKEAEVAGPDDSPSATGDVEAATNGDSAAQQPSPALLAVSSETPQSEQREDRLEDLPGRPIGRDEIDPELIALPRTKTRIGVVLSLCVVVFCGYIMTHLYGDLRFSRKGDEPQALTSMAEAVDPANAERFVQVRAVPDRSFVARIAPSKADPGSRVAPVQGSDDRLWLMMNGSVWTAGIRYDEVYHGRLRRAADLPFTAALRRHIEARAPAPRFVQPREARAALANGGAATLTAPGGDTIPVTGDTAVHIYQEVFERVRIHAFTTEALKTAEAWSAALAEAGVLPPGTRPTEVIPIQKASKSWVFMATVPGGVEATRATLRDKKLHSALIEPVEKDYHTTWGALAQEGDDLTFGDTRVPWRDVQWVAVDVPRRLPANALILLTQEKPETYWYVLPLFILLGLFGLLFLWALVRTVRANLAPDEVSKNA